MPWLFSVRVQVVIALFLCVGGTLAAWWFSPTHQNVWWHWLASWLLIVNLVAFIYYGLDKYLAARWVVVRIPERVLHLLSALGGSPAALVAMWLFRHKTIKPSFRILFWCIVVVQLALVIYIIVKLL